MIPPLRDRDDDVQLLADHFLDRAAQRLAKPKCLLEADARELFANYDWPGNVRELENIITRACVLNEGHSISAAELRPWLQDPERVGNWSDGCRFAGWFELGGCREVDDSGDARSSRRTSCENGQGTGDWRANTKRKAAELRGGPASQRAGSTGSAKLCRSTRQSLRRNWRNAPLLR